MKGKKIKLILSALVVSAAVLAGVSLTNNEKSILIKEQANVEKNEDVDTSVPDVEDIIIEDSVQDENDIADTKNKGSVINKSEPVVAEVTKNATEHKKPGKVVVDKTEQSANGSSSGNPVPGKEEFQKPEIEGNTVSEDITGLVGADHKLTEAVEMESKQGVKAIVPEGTKIAEGVKKLKLSIEEKEKSDSDVTVGATEKLDAYDIHIEGLASDNTKPVAIELGKVLPSGLNKGNLSLYHVEKDATVEMKEVASVSDFSAHNQFAYNPEDGSLAVAMMSFSEVAVVSDTEAKWNGKFDYTWYDAAKTEFIIANADQLAGFGAIVGGMAEEIERDTFENKKVTLIVDINLGDNEDANNPDIIFYPIGYYNSSDSYTRTNESITSSVSSFKGTFDGNGHTISNFYQNTWEMFGDYNDGYSAGSNYYKDAMGLFGYVNGGTVKNLTVDNFSSDGEFTPTGVVAAYASNATFENIAITNCNPRVYNTGNGGIVGIGGNTGDTDNEKLTFKNITIDNTNKISALWGSWDVACGGLVGMFRGAGHMYMNNCHVAAQMDVFNDVCGNYQYYWYRYAGMLVGTNKNMTEKDGYTVPETEKFHASDCTVHFGEWNDYYYCELVANSLASYTHDHQFSRLTQVDAVDVENKKVTVGGETTAIPASGRYNYVVVKGQPAATENAECYHFVNGEEWTHEMAGTETVNGIEGVLKENNQHIKLSFNQLFTGYGWGVKHVPVGEFEGVTILDREVAGTDSVVKFESTGNVKFVNDSEIKVSEIFQAIETYAGDIKAENVQVTVSPIIEDGKPSQVSAVYVVDEEKDWKNGTIIFSGTGKAIVTITDYYFCTPTTIEVTIEQRQAETKFESKFSGAFLYRVGNINAVSLGSLFGTTEEVGTVSVTINPLDGTAATGAYTVNSDWSKSTIQFSGTGIVEVIVKDDDKYCAPTSLVLEVVDGKNATSKASATANNVVLLNDVSGEFAVSNGYTFYGNGFKVNCSGDGSYRSAAISYGFVTVESGGVLDNVQIICDIFPESYMYTSEMEADSNGRYPYGYSAVVVGGNSTISNCYIYGARNNILVTAGDVTIKNTVTECGSLSNIQIKSTDANTVTLEDVTTIQYQATSKYDTSKKIMGFGVVVGDNESASNPTIKLAGDFKQYNWVTNADTNISNSYAKTAISEALGVVAYQHMVNATTTVNTGIAYLNSKEAIITDERSNKVEIPYKLGEISMGGYTGKVCSVSGSNITAESRYNAETDEVIPYVAKNNGIVLPDMKFLDGNGSIALTYGYDNAEAKTVGKLAVDLDNITGGSYGFTFDKLNVQKYGKNLTFTVKDSAGNTIDKNSVITLNQLYTGKYTLIITDDKIYNAAGELTGSSVEHVVPFILNATKTSIEPPKFTNAGTATAIRLVEKSGGDWRPAYTVLTGVNVTYWSASESKVQTVDLSTLYNSGTISSNVWTYTCDDYTLTITGGQVHSDGTTITPVVSNSTLYFASTNKAFTTGTTSRSMILTYVFTDKNASTTWNRTETVSYEGLSEYDFSSFKNGTLSEPSSSSSGCVTPDTKITLADGTQKEVKYLNPGEELLVWNLETGSYDTATIVFVDSEKEADYEVINLNFSDGSHVDVIYEHGFFDVDLGKYVYITVNNYSDYVGHRFVTMGDTAQNTWNVVTLESAVVKTETTTAWSPVTFKDLCYYTNGVLSMPGGIEGLFNIFDVDTNIMAYDSSKMAEDIENYGLLTFADYNGLIPEIAYEAFNGEYLNVAIGKGLLSWETIEQYANRYVPMIPSLVADGLLAEVHENIEPTNAEVEE